MEDSSKNPWLAEDAIRGLYRKFLVLAGLLALAFIKPLVDLAGFALKHDLHSHTILIPFISGYLVYIQWQKVPREGSGSRRGAVVSGLLGLAALGLWGILRAGGGLSQNDYLSLTIFALVCFVNAAAWGVFGAGRVKPLAFAMVFLIFMTPMPGSLTKVLEIASQYASAEAANLFFLLSQTTMYRDGVNFVLPGITIQVAEECSGIRSSYVLFITSLVAGQLFLRSAGSRAALALVILPLGVLRNGFRVWVISMLCVHISPEMIHSVIHKRGGPFFFALSLIPLFLFMIWLRRREQKRFAKTS